MIRGAFLLLVCQLVGEALARGFGLPVPGPVLGLGLLVIALALWHRWLAPGPDMLPASDVGRVSEALLGSLALLFVPAGVGVVQHLGTIGSYGIALGLALVGSTLATLLATVVTFLVVKRWVRGRPAEGA